MNRGISTVLDVGFAIVLVGASVAVLTGVPAPGPATPPADHLAGGVAVAGSTLTVQYDRADGESAVVTGTVGTLLRDAAIARHMGVGEPFATSVTAAVDDRIEGTGTPTQLVGACVPASASVSRSTIRDRVVAGPAPPTGASVDATVYKWNGSVAGRADCEPVVVVRSWSP